MQLTTSAKIRDRLSLATCCLLTGLATQASEGDGDSGDSSGGSWSGSDTSATSADKVAL